MLSLARENITKVTNDLMEKYFVFTLTATLGIGKCDVYRDSISLNEVIWDVVKERYTLSTLSSTADFIIAPCN